MFRKIVDQNLNNIQNLDRPPKGIRLPSVSESYEVYATMASLDTRAEDFFGDSQSFMFGPDGFLSREVGYFGAGTIYKESDLFRFSNKRGLIVGAGSIGGGIFMECIRLGAGAGENGRIDIIEPGLGDVSNITRQTTQLLDFNFGELTGGSPKTLSAVRFAQLTNPFAKVVGHRLAATPELLRKTITESFDYVVMGADASMPLVNYELLAICNEKGIPVFGGLDLGEVGVSLTMLPGQGSSMRNALLQTSKVDLENGLEQGGVHPFSFLVKMIDPIDMPVSLMSDILALLAQSKDFLSQSRDASSWVGRMGASNIVNFFSDSSQHNQLVRPLRSHNHITSGFYASDLESIAVHEIYRNDRNSWILQYLDPSSHEFKGDRDLARAFFRVLDITLQDLTSGRNPLES